MRYQAPLMPRRAKPAPRALWPRRRRRPAALPGSTLDLLAGSQSAPAGDNPRVSGSGDQAFRRIVERVGLARRSVEIRAFLWRDDEAGNQLGEAVLAAAERGVQVRISKDRIAAAYEYAGGNKQSFFHKHVDPIRGVQAWFLGAVFKVKGSFKQKPNQLAQAVLAHPNIAVEYQRKRFDHSKVYIVDDEWMCLGSMGVGDNHTNDWFDLMVELDGAKHIERLRQRMAGDDEFDPSRGIDFLVHSRSAHRPRTCPMATHRLALIDSARTSVTIEMAYLGDRRYTYAMARAVERGVALTLVTAERADVLGNVNRAVCDAVRKLTGAPPHLQIVLVPRMVHSKAVVIDHHVVDVGSANFTPLSHGVYDEINLYADHAGFATALEAEIGRHAAEGTLVDDKVGHRPIRSGIEKMFVAYQARKGG